MEFTKNDIKITPREIKAVITMLDKKTANLIYGEKAIDPNKEMFVIECENAEYGVKHDEAMSYFENGAIPDNSKMGLLIARYDKIAVGQEIVLEKNLKGFWSIRL